MKQTIKCGEEDASPDTWPKNSEGRRRKLFSRQGMALNNWEQFEQGKGIAAVCTQSWHKESVATSYKTSSSYSGITTV